MSLNFRSSLRGFNRQDVARYLEYLNNLDGKPVPVDQNGKNAIWVGKMTLDIVKNK